MYEIPEDHANLLRTGLGLPEYTAGEPTPIPANVYDAYVRFKRIRDRIDKSALSTESLVWILLDADRTQGVPTPKEQEPESVASLFRKGELKHGDVLGIKWRNQDIECKLIGATGDDSEMIVDIAGDEKRVATSRLKVLQPA